RPAVRVGACAAAAATDPRAGAVARGRGMRVSAHAVLTFFAWRTVMKRIVFVLALAGSLALFGPSVGAFCGFYVAKADPKLFNRASQVVLVRDGDRTVLTMANDFKGNPQEFAIVIPVPTRIERNQIHV